MSLFPRATPSFSLPAALAGILLVMACHEENPPGRTFMGVEADGSWTAFDSLVLTLRDAEGRILDTLFHGPLRSPGDLERLPADYEGGRIRVVLEGYRDGRPVKRETREYDGRTQELYGIHTENLTSGEGNPAVLDIKPDSLILYLGGRKELLAPGSAWNGTLSWRSGDMEVVTVQAGELTAVGPGRTVVEAWASDSVKDSAWVEVVRDPPVLTVGADTSILVNSIVTWTVKVAQAHGLVEMFKWDTDGDGRWDDSASGFPAGQSEFSTPPRQYDATGRFTLRFLARDGEKNVDSAAREVTVAGKVPAIDSLGAAPLLVSIRDSVAFSARVAAGEGARQAYAWDFDGDGHADDTGAFATETARLRTFHAYPHAGDFRAALLVTDGIGSKVSGHVTVKVRRASPTADAGKDVQARVGAAVTLAGSATDSLDGQIVKWEWILGAADPVPSDAGGRITFTPAAPGLLLCIFRVTDDDGLVDEDTVRVEVADGKAPEVAFATAPVTLSIRDSATFTARAKGVGARLARYAWDFDGDGQWDDSGSVSADSLVRTRGYRFGGPKVYPVTFQAVDEAGFQATATLPVAVKEDRPWARAGNDTTVGLGERVVLRGESGDSLGTVVKREWKVGDSVYATGPGGEFAFTPASAGEWNCVFRVTDDDSLVAQAAVKVTVVASSLARLSGLSLAAGALQPDLQPGFSAGRTSYTSNVANSVDSIRLIATVQPGSGATLRIQGESVLSGIPSRPIPLQVGPNNLTAVVTAQDGVTVMTYSVVVTRAANSDASLSRIQTSAGVLSPPFDTAVTAYSLKVDSAVASLSLTLTPRFPTTTLTVNQAPAAANQAFGPVPLPLGNSTVSIVATAQAGNARTYTLKVTRGPYLFVLDDFDRRARTTPLGGAWAYSHDWKDGGTSQITSGDMTARPTAFNDSSFIAPGRSGTGLAARMVFVYGPNKPSCGAGCAYGQWVALRAGAHPAPADITDATQISFYARASAPMTVRFNVEMANVLDGATHRALIDVSTQWTRHVVLLRTGAGGLNQPAWTVDPKPLDLARLSGINWEISADENPSLTQGALYLDDVVITGWPGP